MTEICTTFLHYGRPFILVSISTVLLNGVLKGLPCLLLEVIVCNSDNGPSFH